MNCGISQSYISRLEKKIINKMKKDIASKIRIKNRKENIENEKEKYKKNFFGNT